jgi:hypothetical protein
MLNVRIRGNGYSPRKAFVARNLGYMTCSKCGVKLNAREIAAMYRLRLRLIDPLCFVCRGFSRKSEPINIDGPEPWTDPFSDRDYIVYPDGSAERYFGPGLRTWEIEALKKRRR